jgi:hypothetical protein
MWTYLRIAGGVVFLVALFLRPLRWDGSSSAFQLMADRHDAESIATFLGSLVLGTVATISTFFSRRVIEWLEMTLTILCCIVIFVFVTRFGIVDQRGISLSWPGLLLIGGLSLIALGAHGRYRNAGRE